MVIEVKVCLWCEKPLGKYRKKFCSDKCQQEHFIHNIAPFWWQNAVEMALDRANYKCEECGSCVDLQVHHIEPLRGENRHSNRKNALDNLIVLCRNCHWKKHRGKSNKLDKNNLLNFGQLEINFEV